MQIYYNETIGYCRTQDGKESTDFAPATLGLIVPGGGKPQTTVYSHLASSSYVATYLLFHYYSSPSF